MKWDWLHSLLCTRNPLTDISIKPLMTNKSLDLSHTLLQRCIVEHFICKLHNLAPSTLVPCKVGTPQYGTYTWNLYDHFHHLNLILQIQHHTCEIVNNSSPLEQVAMFSTLQVLFGRRMVLTSWAHGPFQLVMKNVTCTLLLATTSNLPEITYKIRKLVTMLLRNLSKLGLLAIIHDKCEWFMIMEIILVKIFSSIIYIFQIGNYHNNESTLKNYLQTTVLFCCKSDEAAFAYLFG